ncbi:AAA family ATPase [Rhodococcus zopfii]
MTTIVENATAPGTEGTEGGEEDMTASTAHSTDPFTSATSTENPFDNDTARENARRTSAEEHRRRHTFYSVADLAAQTTAPKARTVAEGIERANMRRQVKHAPTLFLTAEYLVKAYVPADELPALTPIDDARVAELRIEEAAQREAAQRAARSRALQIEAERNARGLEMPERVNLAEYVPPPVRWIIEGMFRQDSNLGLFAERKAGKSTAVRDIVRSLLDGSDVFGRFPVTFDPADEVVLIDSEMPVDLLHEQYTDAGVTGLDRLHLYSIRGRERTFDVRSPEVRERWAQLIPAGSVIVFDCLYAVLAALGVRENDDTVSEVTGGLRALVAESGARGAIMVHHLGKDPERGARGHSSIEGFADVLAHIRLTGPIYDQNTERVLTLRGRCPDLPESTLVLGSDHRLTLEDREEKRERKKAERRATQDEVDEQKVIGILRAHPGLTVRDLLAHRGDLPEKRAQHALSRLQERGLIENHGTKAKGAFHVAAGAGTDPFATPATVAEPPA